MFDWICAGRMEEASELYWRMDPLRKTILGIAVPSAHMGMYNFDQWKYCEELLGFTGGELRMPKMMLYPHQKMQLREAMMASGLTPVK